MSAIGSANNTVNPLYTNTYTEPVAVNDAPAADKTEGTKESQATGEPVDTIEKSATPAKKQSVVMTAKNSLVEPNYHNTKGIISQGAKFDETWHSVNTRGKHIQSDLPDNATPEDFRNWIHNNLSDASDVASIWADSFTYDYSHCLDVFAYSVLEAFQSKKGVCREDAITKTYMLNELGYEAKAVAYAEPDCFHVVSFYKDKDTGKWNIAEYGKIHELGADSFEEALAKALPSANNFWIWNNAEADKSAYVEKRVRTHHGEELKGFISGTRDGSKYSINIDNKDGKPVSFGFDIDNEKAAGSVSFNNIGLQIDARYNLPSLGNSGIGGNMGGQNGALWIAARESFNDHFQLSLAYGYMPQMGVRDAGDSGSTASPMHMLALGANWNTDIYANSWKDNTLRFSSTMDGTVAIPIYFHQGGKIESLGMTIMDTDIDVTSHNHFEWDARKDLTLSADYTMSVDVAHSAANLLMGRFQQWTPPAINQFAEIGATYHRDNFALSANLYAPITIFDTRYGEDFLWNVQGKVTIKDDWKLTGSISGGFTSGNPLVNASAGISYKDKVSLNFGASGLDTPSSRSFNVGVKINF